MGDLTVYAVPGYFAAMAAEHRWLRRHGAERGPTAADYETRDTAANLAMGLGSLLVPLVAAPVVRRLAPGRTRFGSALVAAAGAAALATAVADRVARDGGKDGAEGAGRADRRRLERWARRVAKAGGVTAVVAGGVAVTTAWTVATAPQRLFARRFLPDMGKGPLALALAVLGWDFVYYWNHRFMHESRFMWAIHVVHHSSERYNLSTALRQPVADSLGTFLPSGALCLLGIRPETVALAHGINLLYQFWIHTDTIRRLGRAEAVLNTPSHHRVHHGSNKRYIDRNHGSILILWDRLFGTFAQEDDAEPVVYGLTRNIHTDDPVRIATHEYGDMLGDVAASRSWAERISYVVRSPGWAYQRREERREERGARDEAAAV